MSRDMFTIRHSDDPIYAVRKLKVKQEFGKLIDSLLMNGYTREEINAAIEAVYEFSHPHPHDR